MAQFAPPEYHSQSNVDPSESNHAVPLIVMSAQPQTGADVGASVGSGVGVGGGGGGGGGAGGPGSGPPEKESPRYVSAIPTM